MGTHRPSSNGSMARTILIMDKNLIIDFGGYGAPESYQKLKDELRRKAQDPTVCSMMQIIALKREQANVDAGDAAKKGETAISAAHAATAEGLREILTTFHNLLNGKGDAWLVSCFEPLK